MRERLDGCRTFRSEESLPTAPDTRTSVKDVGREPGPWHRNDNHPLQMRWCHKLRSQGEWMKRRILVGASWKSGSTSSPESSRLVLVTLSRMPSLQESSGTVSYTAGCKKALQ